MWKGIEQRSLQKLVFIFTDIPELWSSKVFRTSYPQVGVNEHWFPEVSGPAHYTINWVSGFIFAAGSYKISISGLFSYCWKKMKVLKIKQTNKPPTFWLTLKKKSDVFSLWLTWKKCCFLASGSNNSWYLQEGSDKITVVMDTFLCALIVVQSFRRLEV